MRSDEFMVCTGLQFDIWFNYFVITGLNWCSHFGNSPTSPMYMRVPTGPEWSKVRNGDWAGTYILHQTRTAMASSRITSFATRYILIPSVSLNAYLQS